ncbi:MAG: SocA family protein [Nitrospira sp.]|nr:SocA family protein [Nitrospira sp.]
MRTPSQISIDRALLLYVLHVAEPYGFLGDVKLQQLCFLCELQTFGKGLKGFHFEFFRFAYGAFSKDLDNDLLSLRRKGRVENFTLSDQANEEVIPLLLKAINGVEVNERIKAIIDAVVATYGPQDAGAITASVEAVELSTPQRPEFKIPIRDIVFHTTLLVPERIEVQAEFTIPTSLAAKLNVAMGYDGKTPAVLQSW